MDNESYQPNTLRSTVLFARGVTYVVYAFVVLSILILVQGFLLKLFGANSEAGYAEWAYRSLDRVMQPFRGLFTPIEIDNRSILDTSILFAVAVYGVVGIAIRSLLDWLTFRLHLAASDRQRPLDATVGRLGDDIGLRSDSSPQSPSSPQAEEPIRRD